MTSRRATATSSSGSRDASRSRGAALLVLERVGELVQLGAGHPEAAADLAPPRHGAFDLADDRPGPRNVDAK